MSFPGQSGTLAGAPGLSGSALLYSSAGTAVAPTYGNGGQGGVADGQPGAVIIRW